MKIIFYGTPEFAVPSLELLLQHHKDIVAVVTAPDKPAGRGRKLTPSPVKEAALKHNLFVFQPEKLKDPEFLETLKNLNADLQIVVAFRMMPEVIWKMPSQGTFNLHGSLLPQYRGAAPINWAIINGEKNTGLTTFFLQQEIDTGRIIFSKEIEITDEDNATSLQNRMMIQGAELVLKTVEAIEKGSGSSTPQEEFIHSELKAAPKLSRENTRIHFNQGAIQIRNMIRGLSLHPGAHCELLKPDHETLTVKIFEAKANIHSHTHAIGEMETDNKTFLKIFVQDGSLDISELQFPGKSRMKIKDVLNGYKFDVGMKFC